MRLILSECLPDLNPGGLRQPSNGPIRASLGVHLHHLEDVKGEKKIQLESKRVAKGPILYQVGDSWYTIATSGDE